MKYESKFKNCLQSNCFLQMSGNNAWHTVCARAALVFTHGQLKWFIYGMGFMTIWQCDDICRHKSSLTLNQTMTSYPMAPTNKLHQCWCNVSETIRNIAERNFNENMKSLCYENYHLFHLAIFFEASIFVYLHGCSFITSHRSRHPKCLWRSIAKVNMSSSQIRQVGQHIKFIVLLIWNELTIKIHISKL